MPERGKAPPRPVRASGKAAAPAPQHVAASADRPAQPSVRQPRAARTKRRTRPLPDHDADGNPVCVVCGKPNHPDHPLSPHCKEHYDKARLDSQRKSREDRKAFEQLADTIVGDDNAAFDDDVHISARGTVLLAAKVRELREARGDLLAAYAQARSLTNDFTPGNTADFYLAQLTELKQAIEDFNEVLAPVLRRPQ